MEIRRHQGARRRRQRTALPGGGELPESFNLTADIRVKSGIRPRIYLGEYALSNIDPKKFVLFPKRETNRDENFFNRDAEAGFDQTQEDFCWEKRLARLLANEGVRMSWFDLLIAAFAFRVRVRVYSIDRHFAAMERHLGLPLYEHGYGGKFFAGARNGSDRPAAASTG